MRRAAADDDRCQSDDDDGVQGDPSGWSKPPVDLVLTALAAGGPLL